MRPGRDPGRAAKGTFVSLDGPEHARLRRAPRDGEPASERRYPERAGFELPPPTVPDLPARRSSDLLLLLGGVPELRFLPQVELARAYRGALKGAAGSRLVDYADPHGDPLLQ